MDRSQVVSYDALTKTYRVADSNGFSCQYCSDVLFVAYRNNVRCGSMGRVSPCMMTDIYPKKIITKRLSDPQRRLVVSGGDLLTNTMGTTDITCYGSSVCIIWSTVGIYTIFYSPRCQSCVYVLPQNMGR